MFDNLNYIVVTKKKKKKKHGNAYYNKNGSSFTQSLDLVSENSPKLCEHCSFSKKCTLTQINNRPT